MNRRTVLVVAVTAMSVAVACSSEDATNEAPTTVVAATVTIIGDDTTSTVLAAAPASTTVPPVVPEGFERVAATVTKTDGDTCEICLWLAETNEQRAQGLMNVTDLGNADGMAFVYPQQRTGNFWMKDTVMPLSIAFFGIGGGHLGEFDMEPCTVDPCPKYPTARDFVVAVETNQGELAEIGIGPGSTLELTDLPCP